jgi:O-acetyl-ADP-ribose deacetylase (regulator of RNase III)
VKVVEGDLLDVTEGLIAHQVNCRGVMGAGIARSIAKRYPEVEEMYRRQCAIFDPLDLLGSCLVVTATADGSVTDNLWVANVFAQLNTGRGLQTDYGALRESLRLARSTYGALTLNVPYSMGCGLAGGDWGDYSAILDEEWDGDVVAHRLPIRT